MPKGPVLKSETRPKGRVMMLAMPNEAEMMPEVLEVEVGSDRSSTRG